MIPIVPGIIRVRQEYTEPMQVPHSFASLVSACGLRPTFAYAFAVPSFMPTAESRMLLVQVSKK
jgi:hypothetical protein